MSERITTPEEVAKEMMENYQEFAIEKICYFLNDNPEIFKSWTDWLNKEGEFSD